jgi:hypothetical protein
MWGRGDALNGRTYFTSKTAGPDRGEKSMRTVIDAPEMGRFVSKSCTYQQPPLPAVEMDLWISRELLCWKEEGRVEVDEGE